MVTVGSFKNLLLLVAVIEFNKVLVYRHKQMMIVPTDESFIYNTLKTVPLLKSEIPGNF